MESVGIPPAEHTPSPLRREDIATWHPWRKGPSDIILECAGGPVARLAYATYLHWPLRRGRRYLPWVIGRIPGLSHQVRHALFRSRFGGTARLDMTTRQFHYLTGLFPPEPHELSLMARLVRRGDTFIDVGANVGLYLVHLIGLVGSGGRYLAFEPDPDNFRFLKEAYSDLCSAEILDIAISDKKGVARLTRKNSLEGTLEPIAGVGDTVEVETRTLNEIIVDLHCKGPLVMKIDVEGHEPAVIRGMSGLMNRGLLPIMQIEYLPTNAGEHRRQIDLALHDIFGTKLSYYGITNNEQLLFPMKLGQPVDDDVLNILTVPPEMKGRVDDLFS